VGNRETALLPTAYCLPQIPNHRPPILPPPGQMDRHTALEPGQVAELRVLDPAGRAVGHHEADLVALQAASLGGRGGLEDGGELEGDGGHQAAAAGVRSCAR